MSQDHDRHHILVKDFIASLEGGIGRSIHIATHRKLVDDLRTVLWQAQQYCEIIDEEDREDA